MGKAHVTVWHTWRLCSRSVLAEDVNEVIWPCRVTAQCTPHLEPPDILSERCSGASGEQSGRSGELSESWQRGAVRLWHFYPKITQRRVQNGIGNS